MPSVRALIVDDSGFFRRRIRALLEADPAIEVVGEAANGREAVELVRRLRPDVVTMDIEMPEMDGISAVREIMRRCPTPVLMFSSLTYDGAKPTFDALDAGAVDFLPKRFSDLSGDAEQAQRLLRERVKLVARRARRSPPPASGAGNGPVGAAPPPRTGAAGPEPRRESQSAPVRAGAAAPAAAPPVRPQRPPEVAPGRVQLVVIGTSTGGPVALQRVLTALPATFPFPLLLIQHMPASFTTAFAQRLDQICQIRVREAQEGDLLRPGTALLAPGGVQLGLRRQGALTSVHLFEAGAGQFYKPSVDIAFEAAAEAFPGRVLGVVLTGMGSDGARGAATLKQGGSLIWAQDEASSVIYGMPGAVTKAGLSDSVLDLDAVGPALAAIRH